MKQISIMILLVLALLQGCSSTGPVREKMEQTASVSVADKEEETVIEQAGLRDRKAIYEQDQEDSVVTMYLTVRRGNVAEGTDHSWSELQQYSTYDYVAMGVDRYQVEAILQVGDETGPLPNEIGYGLEVPNATVQIRGQTSSRNAQKNYKIRLKDNKGLWREQQTIALNKHQTDGLRFRNKMGFDLLKGMDQTMSLRTQFVHLYVKDETEEGSTGFVDYGLYTQVEQPNKKMLRSHGMDPSGDLYKINQFEFYRMPEVIRNINDPEFDEGNFSFYLENKSESDNEKLIRLLNDLNNYNLSAAEFVSKHIDVENLSYWMAFQILTANMDTQNRNFYIYSPSNSEVWYILPWDLDGAWKQYEFKLNGRTENESWETGISNYWGNQLFRRCLQDEHYRKALDQAIAEVRSYLNPERILSMAESYRAVTEPFAYRMPDQLYAPLTPSEYDEVIRHLPEIVEIQYEKYQESLKKPMPFYIGQPLNQNGKLLLSWETAYDFNAEDIEYDVTLARDYMMQDVVFETTNLKRTSAEIEELPPGQYFLQVLARNVSGYEQSAFDYYVIESGKVYGTKCFYVLEDGSIKEDVYEE